MNLEFIKSQNLGSLLMKSSQSNFDLRLLSSQLSNYYYNSPLTDLLLIITKMVHLHHNCANFITYALETILCAPQCTVSRLFNLSRINHLTKLTVHNLHDKTIDKDIPLWLSSLLRRYHEHILIFLKVVFEKLKSFFC